jgi:predicted metalloendopeptidase
MSRLPSRLAAALAAALPVVCAAALDTAGISRDISPCDDFYAYANRQWLEATTIPEDKSDWGTFAIIAKRNKEVLKAILADAAASNPFPPGSNRHKVVAYYRSGMDEAAIARAGLAPLAPVFSAIDSVKEPADLPAAIAALHRSGIRAGFGFTVRQDAKDSRRYLAELQQGGLGLPDRDYYFRDDERSKAQREAYRAHVARMFGLAGEQSEAAARLAADVMDLETALAGAHMTLVERRDPDKTYNLRATARLAEEAPGLDWKAYFAAAGVPDLAEVNVAQPGAAAALAKLAATRPAAQWRAYLRWHALNAAATKLPREFEEENFAFFQRTLTGVREMPPRNERVIEAISGRYGGEPLAHALGELFVGEAFPPEAKRRALELVGHVKAALRERLEKLDWMEEATRKAALDKLDRMAVKIGYPDRWRDFSPAEIGAGPFAANWLAANRHEFARTISRLGKPVDRGEWWMSPHIVNAYYGATLNEIVFPAGILQPPYFDAKADDAVNFGGIGMVIGHEIMHGFDDRGRRYDADGNLREWWTAADRERYQQRAQAVVAQYDAYAGVDGLKVNGKLTLGENIADLGGIQIAYLALQRALAGKPRERIDGFTPEQRYYISFAQVWRARLRPEQERLRLLTDGHSPPRYRVQGPLANQPEFAAAFSCPADSKAMRAPGDRVTLW